MGNGAMGNAQLAICNGQKEKEKGKKKIEKLDDFQALKYKHELQKS